MYTEGNRLPKTYLGLYQEHIYGDKGRGTDATIYLRRGTATPPDIRVCQCTRNRGGHLSPGKYGAVRGGAPENAPLRPGLCSRMLTLSPLVYALLPSLSLTHLSTPPPSYFSFNSPSYSLCLSPFIYLSLPLFAVFTFPYSTPLFIYF